MPKAALHFRGVIDLFRWRPVMMKVLFLGLLSLVLVLPGAVFAEEAILLRFAPEVGDEYDAALLTTLRIEITEEGKKEEIYSTIGLGYNLRFTAIEADGIGTGVLSCHMLKMFMSGQFLGTIYYDSTDPFMYIPREVQVPAMLLGEEVTIKTDSKLNIIECELEAVAERILQRWSSLREHTGEEETAAPSSADRAMVKAQIEKVLAELCKNTNPDRYYPERPFKVGDSWATNIQKENNGLVMQLAIVSTLVERTDGIAVIKEEGSVTLDGFVVPEAVDSMELETAEYYGIVRIREDNGFPVAQESKLRLAWIFQTNDGPIYVYFEVDVAEKSSGPEGETRSKATMGPGN